MTKKNYCVLAPVSVDKIIFIMTDIPTTKVTSAFNILIFELILYVCEFGCCSGGVFKQATIIINNKAKACIIIEIIAKTNIAVAKTDADNEVVFTNTICVAFRDITEMSKNPCPKVFTVAYELTSFKSNVI